MSRKHQNRRAREEMRQNPPQLQGGVPLFQKNGGHPADKNSPMSGMDLNRVLQILEHNQVLLQKQFENILMVSRSNAIRTAAWIEAWEEVATDEQMLHHHQHLERILKSYADGTHPNLQGENGEGSEGDPGGEAEAQESPVAQPDSAEVPPRQENLDG